MIRNNKIEYDETWKEDYEELLMTPLDAVGQIKPGNRVFIGTGCGQPQALVKAMVKRSTTLSEVEIIDFLTIGSAPHASDELSKKFRINSFFIGDRVRDTIQKGLGDYTPIFLSDIPELFSSGKLPLDVVLIHVSPPNSRGRCSLGVSVDIVKSAAENASLVIAQVNPNMPFTHGDSWIHIHNIDILVPVDDPIIEVQPVDPDETTSKIGEFIAGLVEDESTVEFGIGAIPQSVVKFLRNKKRLGIHTEMFTDTIIELIESGAVDGSCKTMDRGKIVASFVMGTKKLYDFIDNNPLFAIYPTEHVNDPFIISRQKKQIAINVALEVDLTGQVCADSIGTSFYSGIGGQVDFNRGAAKSKGGKAIIALHSTAKNGTISRITSVLSKGSGVVTTRGDVHYIVTEYGVAYLHGKSIQERSIALISIAHPKFRGDLLKEAIQLGFLTNDYTDLDNGFVFGNKDYHTIGVLEDGTVVNYRSMLPTDEASLKELFYALSKQTMYYRFMSRTMNLPRKKIQDFVYVNHRTDVAIVATVPEASGDKIIGIGKYYLDETTNFAEVAFTVHDEWQNRGIGTSLLNQLLTIAKRNGISGFTAEVLRENRSMQSVLQKCDCKVTSKVEWDIVSFDLKF